MEKGLDLLSVLFPTEPQTIYIQILVEKGGHLCIEGKKVVQFLAYL
jgi:hypothetical protein